MSMLLDNGESFDPGFYENVPDEIYFIKRLGIASNSKLRIIDTKTLGHYYHYVTAELPPEEDTPAKIIGKAFHCLILEPHQFLRRYAIMPIWESSANSNYGKAERAAWFNQNDGRTPLPAAMFKMISDMRESVMRHKTAAIMLDRGKREVVMRWVDPETGIECEGKVDLWDEEMGYFLDLKSTLDAGQYSFSRSVTEYRYNVQHAMYSTGSRELGKEISRFFQVPVEKDAPHFSALYHIDEAGIERGIELMRRSLLKLKAGMDSLKAGNPPNIAFPAYGDGILTLTLPGWAYSD